MLAKLWRQHEVSDGTYDIHDLAEILKVLEVYEENQRRAHRAAVEAAKQNHR